MKTKIIIGSLIAFVGIAKAQWSTSGTSIYKDPNNNGNVGIGTTSPSDKLHIVTGSSNTGMIINQTGSGASIINLKNTTTGGHTWWLASTGNGNSQGAGHFDIYDFGASGGGSGVSRLFISGTDGNVGMGTQNPGAKLEVNQVANPSGYATAGSFFSLGNSQTNLGIRAEASNGTYNNAATFVTSGGSTQNIGVMISNNPSGTPVNDWGIFCYGKSKITGNFEVVGNTVLSGQTDIIGTGFINGSAITSDRKLKKDIKPLTNGLAKIMLLKPSTYTFRIEEFKNMNLPKENQIGLIAQELEEVYPELVLTRGKIELRDEKGKIKETIEEHKSVNYTALIPVLIAGIQEQQFLIENQQKQLAEQKEMINALVNKAGSSTGMNDLNVVPGGFNLEQNIPNPFNSETVIGYTVPDDVKSAVLAVYDLSGKQIASFPLTEKGTSSITITSEKLAAGIYIYSILTDGKIIDTKRLVVAQK